MNGKNGVLRSHQIKTCEADLNLVMEYKRSVISVKKLESGAFGECEAFDER